MTTLGEYTALLREQKGWTMRELARKAGISLGAIQKIENGSTSAPGIDILLALSRAFNINPMNLILAYEGKDPNVDYGKISHQDLTSALQSAINEVLKSRGIDSNVEPSSKYWFI